MQACPVCQRQKTSRVMQQKTKGEKRPVGEKVRCLEAEGEGEDQYVKFCELIPGFVKQDVSLLQQSGFPQLRKQTENTFGITPNQNLSEHKLSTVHGSTWIFECKYEALLHLQSNNLNRCEEQSVINFKLERYLPTIVLYFHSHFTIGETYGFTGHQYFITVETH